MTSHDGRRDEGGTRLQSERGSALVLTALLMVMLLGGTAFVLDYGVMWIARRQAQNAADAGALAGAVAAAYDEAGTPADGGPAWTAATQAATANPVWNETPGVAVSWDCPSFVSIGGLCVHVEVYRDGTNGSNRLPTYFGRALESAALRVKATATAQAVPANASDCLRPWAIPDLWIQPDAQPTDPIRSTQFNRYYDSGSKKGQLYQAPDVPDAYAYPGYTLEKNLGNMVTLKMAPQGSIDPISPGWFLAIDVPRLDGPSTGGAWYGQNIYSCNGAPIRIGSYLATETGAKNGPTVHGMELLKAQDPAATYNTATNTIEHSCVATNSCTQCDPNTNPVQCGLPYPGATISPRVVAVAAYDPDDYQQRSTNNLTGPCVGGGQCVKIVQIFGFFIDQVDTKTGDVTGYLVKKEGLFVEGGWTINPGVDFVWAFRLVR